MRKGIILLFSLFTLLTCRYAGQETAPRTESEQWALTTEDKELSMRNVQFAFRFFQACMPADSSTGNFFISPLSASFALGMVLNGAAGDTEREIRSVLQQENYSTEQINRYYEKVMTKLPRLDTSVRLNLANSIWIKKDYPVHNSFKKINRKIYQAEVRNLDFMKVGAAEKINRWCEEKTCGNIPQVIDQLQNKDRLLLINALFFKGEWKNAFGESDSRQEVFYSMGQKNDFVQMMHQISDFRFLKNEYFEMAWLPYGNQTFSMVILLPSTGKSWRECMNALTEENWNRWKQTEPFQRELDLALPRFTLKYGKNLNPILQNLGMKKAFTQEEALLSGITDRERLNIGSVYQHTFLEISEEGTKAAAATVTKIIAEEEIDTVYKPYPFHVNRPFILLIEENSTGNILFIGKITELGETNE